MEKKEREGKVDSWEFLIKRVQKVVVTTGWVTGCYGNFQVECRRTWRWVDYSSVEPRRKDARQTGSVDQHRLCTETIVRGNIYVVMLYGGFLCASIILLALMAYISSLSARLSPVDR